MSTNITASPEEPSNSLPVPSVGEDVDAWGVLLNEQTFVTLLAYILWLKENIGGSPAAEDVAFDNSTSGLTAEDVQAAIDEVVAGLGSAAAADTGDFATAAQGSLADSALQPGAELTALAATGVTAGYVPKADGAGNIAWGAESGGGGPVTAEDVTYDNGTSGLTAEDVQAALDEVYAAVVAGGIPAASGLVVVQHGAVAATARPTAGVVYWMGSVAPDNRVTGDLWLETGAFD